MCGRIIRQKDPRISVDSVVVASTDKFSQSETDLQITLKGEGPWPSTWEVVSTGTSDGQTVISLRKVSWFEWAHRADQED